MNKLIDEYFELLKATIDKLDKTSINNLIGLLLNARKNGSTIYIMGNGGSATSASHIACDFNKGLSYQKDIRFKFICLNDNTATMMAYSNDVGYEDIFVEQLKNFIKKDDVVIGISSSGKSKNVIRAIEYSNSIGAQTVAFVGFDGGELKKISKTVIHVNVNNVQISEDVHMSIWHMLYNVLIVHEDFK